jgi:spoIIIJ-associated protein
MVQATGKSDDLEEALGAAVGSLLDVDHVEVHVALPGGVDVGRVEVTLEADVSIETDEPTGREIIGEDVEAAPQAAHETPDGPIAGDEAVPVADTRQRTPVPEHNDEPDLDAEADAAADFVEGLLDALDLPGHLTIRLHDDEDQAEVEIVDVGSGALIGRRGQTLEAIQELLRSALQRQFQRRSRVKVDVEGYRARRLEKLLEKANEAIDDVLDDGEPIRLEPMDVFERKSVHRTVARIDGVSSRSQGREPARRVVIERE